MSPQVMHMPRNQLSMFEGQTSMIAPRGSSLPSFTTFTSSPTMYQQHVGQGSSWSMPLQAFDYISFTTDATTKETATLRRKCFNCQIIEPPSWRRSTLAPGKIVSSIGDLECDKPNTDDLSRNVYVSFIQVCNRCGLYERTHSRPRPAVPGGSELRKLSTKSSSQFASVSMMANPHSPPMPFSDQQYLPSTSTGPPFSQSYTTQQSLMASPSLSQSSYMPSGSMPGGGGMGGGSGSGGGGGHPYAMSLMTMRTGQKAQYARQHQQQQQHLLHMQQQQMQMQAQAQRNHLTLPPGSDTASEQGWPQRSQNHSSQEY